MGQVSNEVYVPGSVPEVKAEEFRRLRKWVSFVGVFATITFFLLIALALIYFLNIPVTPYQAGRSSLFAQGRSSADSKQQKKKEIELMRKVNDLEQRLLDLQNEMGNLTESLQQSNLQTKNFELAMRSKLEAVNQTSERRVEDVNGALKTSDKQIRDELKRLEGNTINRIDRIAPEIDSINQTLVNLTEMNADLRQDLGAARESIRGVRENVSGTMRNVDTRVQARIQQTNRKTAMLEAKVDYLKENLTRQDAKSSDGLKRMIKKNSNDLEILKRNSANHSEVADLKHRLDARLTNTTGNLEREIQQLSNRTSESFAAVDQKQHRLSKNITNVKLNAEEKLNQVSLDVSRLGAAASQNISTVGLQFNGKVAELKGNISNWRNRVQIEILQSMRNTNALTGRLTKRIGVLAKSFSLFVRNAVNRSEVSQTRNELTALIDHVTGKMKSDFDFYNNKTQRSLSDMRQKQNASLEFTKNAIQVESASLRNTTLGLLHLHTAIDGKILGLENDTDSQFKTISQNMISLQDAIKSTQRKSAQLEPELDVLKRNLTAVNVRINSNLASLPSQLQRIENELDEIRKNVSNVVNKTDRFIVSVNSQTPSSGNGLSLDQISTLVRPELQSIRLTLQQEIENLAAQTNHNITTSLQEVKALNRQIFEMKEKINNWEEEEEIENDNFGGEQEPE